MSLDIRKHINSIKGVFGSLLFLFSSVFVRRNENWIALSAWDGMIFADNSKYLLEYMLENLEDDYRFYWIYNSKMPDNLPDDPRLKAIKKNAFSTMITMLRCKYMFCSQHLYNDLCSYNVFRGAVVTYLHHGLPIKKWGNDAIGASIEKKDTLHRVYQSIIPYHRHYEFFAISSATHGEHFITGLRDYGCSKEKLLPFGTPRNDFLINSSDEYRQLLKKQYAESVGFDPSKKLVLYLPTYRRKTGATQTLFRNNLEERNKLFSVLEKHNAILVEKKHFVEEWMRDELFQDREYEDNYIRVSQDVNAQELLLISDMLISDYSGAFVDYLLVDKPIIHYVYDYEEYRDQDSGLYYDISEFESGSVAWDFIQLINAIDENLNNPEMHKDLRKKRREFFLEYETGRASDQIVNKVVRNAGNKDRR